MSPRGTVLGLSKNISSRRQSFPTGPRHTQTTVAPALPGKAPSGTEPLNTSCVNWGLLSFWSVTVTMISIGSSTGLPFSDTAWEKSCRAEG